MKDGLHEAEVLDHAPPVSEGDRLLVIVTDIKGAAPDISLREIAVRPEDMREPTSRYRVKRATSSIVHLLERAKKAGMLEVES